MPSPSPLPLEIQEIILANRVLTLMAAGILPKNPEAAARLADISLEEYVFIKQRIDRKIERIRAEAMALPEDYIEGRCPACGNHTRVHITRRLCEACEYRHANHTDFR